MKQHRVEVNDWTPYQKTGKTVADARAAIATLEGGEKELAKGGLVVAIYDKGRLLLDDDAIPSDTSKTVARVVQQHTYDTALQQVKPKPTEQLQPIEEPKPAALQEAPKKPTLAEIDLSEYIGETVADARAAIAQLLDLKENHVVAIYSSGKILQDADIIPNNTEKKIARVMLESAYQTALDRQYPKPTEQLQPIEDPKPEAALQKAPKKPSINKINLSDYTGQPVVQARAAIAQLVEVPEGKIIVFDRKQDLILDTETLSDLSGVTASFMKIEQHTQLNAPKNVWKISDIDGTEIEIEGSTLEIALATYFGDDAKVNRYETKQGLIVGTNYSSTRFYIGDYDFYKYGNSLCYIPSNTKHADIQAALEEALSTEGKRVGVDKLEIGRKKFEIEENPYVTCIVHDGNKPKSIKIHSFNINKIKEQLKTQHGFNNHHLISAETILDSTLVPITEETRLHHKSVIKIRALDKNLYSLFSLRDGSIKEISIVDKQDSPVSQLHNAFSRAFSHNGVGVTGIIQPREDNDYTNSGFYISNRIIRVEVSTDPITYVFADGDVFENNDAALKAAVGLITPLDKMVKFISRDEEAMFVHKQGKYDMNTIAERLFDMESAIKLIGANGLNVTFDEPDDHDYRAQAFFNPKTLIEIKLSNGNTIYADAAKFDGKDAALQAALDQRRGCNMTLDQFLKFRAADGNVRFTPHQDGQDDLAIIARALNLDTATKLLGENGITAEARENHDYRDLYIAKESSKINLPDNTFVYVDREKLDSEDDIKAEFTARFGYEVNLEWDPNDPEVGIISKVPEVAPVPQQPNVQPQAAPLQQPQHPAQDNAQGDDDCQPTQPNPLYNVLLGLASGASATLLTHLASTYFETEVHNAAKVIIGVVVGYAIYRHLEQQNTTEQSL